MTQENAATAQTSEESITGRSVFLVETTAAGIAVQTALLANDGRLLRAPAVFPDAEYAFSQIEELKRLVSRHFSEAARVGAQVVAAQRQQSDPSVTPETTVVSAATPLVSEEVTEATPTSKRARASGKK